MSRRTRQWLIVGVSVLAFLIVMGWMAVGPLLSPQFESHMRGVLAEYFGGDASFRSLRVSIFPWPRVYGEGFVLRHRGRTDIPPLIAIERFSTSATWTGLLRRPRRVRHVTLEKLQINIPARPEGEPLMPESLRDREGPSRAGTPVVIENIQTPDARLSIAPRESWKAPRVFDIHDLVLEEVATDRPMRFTAKLTNPTPPGEIDATGSFGPWASGEPADTPVSGDYVFEGADLGVFKGISGTLSSTGTFDGALGRIAVKGTTITPDFTVTIAGNPVDLKTTFQAIVDGTNGNTWLKPVEATVLQSVILADGGIVQQEGGREVELEVSIDEARIEDLLRLAVKGTTPLMTGSARIDTKLRIPPGDRDVVDKLELDGSFHIGEAKFTSVDVQRSIGTLSQRGRGIHDAAPGTSTVSDLQGRFRLRDGTITFSTLQFAVPGATVRMAGSYGLRSEKLDFRGKLRLAAKLSETVGGVKSVFLKLLDPFFRKNGAGAELPIKVEGVRDKPKFGLDTGALLPGN